MAEQITLEEALELVEFQQDVCGGWRVGTVKGNCHVVKGHCTIVEGDCVCVRGKVRCTINGREWKFIEEPPSCAATPPLTKRGNGPTNHH